MPGICGFTGASPREGAERLLAGMIERMTHYAWYGRQAHRDPAGGVALGRVSLGSGREDPGPALAAGDGSAVFLDGEVYGEPLARAQDRLLAACAAGGEPDACLASLRGLFSGAVWDAAGRRLLLGNDRFGMKPLYYAQGDGRLAFASEIKALLADGAVPRALVRQGILSFFSYGQLYGELTFLAGIRALPPGTVLEYRPDGGRVTLRRYVRLRSRNPEPGVTDREHIARLGELFETAMARRLTGDARLGLSLSGGLDSRTILAVADETRFPMTTICLGLPGSLDQRAARRMAAATCSRHCDCVVGREFLDRFEEHLREMVWLTDGHHRSPALALPALAQCRELGIEVLFRGHAGELLHMRKAYEYSVDEELLAARDEAGIEAWLGRRLRGGMLDGVEGPLLKGLTREELGARSRELLRNALRGLGEVEPPLHRVWLLFLDQLLRRGTAMSMLKYGSLLRVRLPYLDEDLIDAVLATPPELKLGDTVQAGILARYRAAFLAIVNSNTGTRIGAGRWRRRLATLRRRAFAKLRVPGYQPYERLGLWLRRELRPLAERTLLDGRCLERGGLEPAAVRRVLAAHAEGRANHTFLILAMLTFELGQRMLLDGEGPPTARAA